MAIYRKIATRIWWDVDFRRLSSCKKLDVLRAIVENKAPPEFECHAGPAFRVADSPKRRPDLSSAEWRAIRREVISERGTICEYCKIDCAADPTVDHVIPACSGRIDSSKDNLVVCCRSCNSRKGGREGWVAYVPHD